MNIIVEKLQKWNCDIISAMNRMLDDEEFYIECLNTIPTDENFKILGEALNNKDISKAFDASHTLKGIFANLGLTPMYNKIVEIVEPLRNGNSENLLGKYNELIQMRNQLCEILHSN